MRNFLIICLSCSLLFACKSNKKEDHRPNIIVIMADDMGYNDLGCYGSEIPTPHLDRLAQNGKIITQFYNAARCCPSRASLLTGRYPHQAGIGAMTEGLMHPDSTIIPSYIGYLNDTSVTIAEVLNEAGYQTFMSGKWHVGDSLTQWPYDRGFEKTFSLIWGASNYFNTKPFINKNQEIVVTENGKKVDLDSDFYFTDKFTEKAGEFIENRDHNKPFFLYLSYTAPHWPIHAPEEDIQLFEGKYMIGWDSLRLQRVKNLKSKKLIPENTLLSPRHKSVPPWHTISPDDQKIWDRRMAVYAAMIYKMDQGIGRIYDKLKEDGELENTIIMFLSDNGATKAEIFWITDWIAERGGPIGSEASFQSYGKWANTSNAPFREFKSKVHEGGILTPFIISWPEKFNHGIIKDYPAHIMDIMPTLIEAAGAEYPEKYKGKRIGRHEGKSLLPVLLGQHQYSERIFFWEHSGEKAVRSGDWKLIMEGEEWKLYNLSEDRTELNDLSAQNPEIKHELEQKYLKWAEKVGVVPDSLYDDLILIRNADWFE